MGKCAAALMQFLTVPAWSSPVSPPLRVVPDFIMGLHPNPLRNGAILLLPLGQESSDSASLVKRHGLIERQEHALDGRQEQNREPHSCFLAHCATQSLPLESFFSPSVSFLFHAHYDISFYL